MNSGSHDVLNAVLPLLKLLTITLIGLLLAHPRFKIAPKSTFRLLSKLVFALFLPCLIFTHLGPCISYKSIVRWWFIPVNILVSTGIGCVLGFAVALICRPPPEFFRFTVIMTAFGNTGNLPLAVVSSVCHNVENPFGPECYGPAVAYVSFSQWVSVLLVYTLVYHMMEPPLEFYEVVDADVDADDRIEIQEITEEDFDRPSITGDALASDLSRPLLVEAEWPGIEDKETEHCKTPFIARLFNSIPHFSHTALPDPDPSEAGGENSPKSVRCLAEPKVIRKIRIVAEKTPIHHILQPAIIASILAIFVGMIPELKDLCFGDDAVLGFLTDSLDIMAGAMVPSAMLVLGGMLAEGPNESRLGLRTSIGIMVARLLVLPLLGIGVVLLADRWGLLMPGDELYKFVLLLQYTTPSAILLGAIASLRGYAVSEASALLFWQHVLALVSLSVYLTVYFKWLLSSS
ncbi:hypothetical protein BT93_L4957 [Corymbia citriodora subsp. variegata]|uniref:Uncharacterized protein n=2 Tax=Corymbia citriodora subsp. variegata TaxID=360336 RepID=A0A8T0CXB9_CORYI|nr:hypothetical protein BT93_L4957 [Corymbia citriodora subsp. variegata]